MSTPLWGQYDKILEDHCLYHKRHQKRSEVRLCRVLCPVWIRWVYDIIGWITSILWSLKTLTLVFKSFIERFVPHMSKLIVRLYCWCRRVSDVVWSLIVQTEGGGGRSVGVAFVWSVWLDWSRYIRINNQKRYRWFMYVCFMTQWWDHSARPDVTIVVNQGVSDCQLESIIYFAH